MFVSLLENVLAQVLRAAISSQASRFEAGDLSVDGRWVDGDVFDVFFAQESMEHPWKIQKKYGEMEIFHNR